MRGARKGEGGLWRGREGTWSKMMPVNPGCGPNPNVAGGTGEHPPQRAHPYVIRHMPHCREGVHRDEAPRTICEGGSEGQAVRA